MDPGDIDTDHKARKDHYIDKLKRQNFEKLLADKEKKRLLDLKREIKRVPKKPKLMSLEVCTPMCPVLLNQMTRLLL